MHTRVGPGEIQTKGAGERMNTTSEIAVRLDEQSQTATLTECGVESVHEFVFTRAPEPSALYESLIRLYGTLGLLATRERE